MNKQQLQANIDTMRAELAEMENQLLQADKPWKPGMGETYWDIDSYGQVSRSVWKEDDPDVGAWAIGNVYRTEQEAIAAHDKQVMQTTLRRRIAELNDGWEPVWSDRHEFKFIVYYSHTQSEWEQYGCGYHQLFPDWRYLKSATLAQQLIGEFSSDELKLGLL